MFRKVGIPILAFLGILCGVFMVYYGKRKPPIPQIAFPPPTSPYEHFVVGAGMIEASSENIEVGVPFSEIVSDIYVKVGDNVKKDDFLFKIDTQDLESKLYAVLKEKEVLGVQYGKEKLLFSFYENLKDKRAVSEVDFANSFYALKEAEKKLEKIDADRKEIETKIQRSKVKAPVDGEVLQVNIKKGAVANVNPFDKKPLVLFGTTSLYHIRVDIDEEDIWRVEKKASATAFVRGNSSLKIPLKFVEIEPYVVPKQSLTGDNSERVDTRVLQIIYSFEKPQFPIYVGQLLDVYIQALPNK